MNNEIQQRAKELLEQGARHLVKELCERFHLLPSEEQISKEYKLLKNEIIPHFKDGAQYILNTLKGEKSNGDH